MPIRNWTIAAIAVPALALTACGSDDMDHGSTDAKSTATTEMEGMSATTEMVMEDTEATGKNADIAFAQGMIMHHQQALELSEIALDPARGASAPVLALAQRIRAAQDPEIEQMKAMLTSWDAPIEMDMTKPHDMSAMEGMLSLADIENLETLNGAEFDKTWATMMKEHHEGAVKSANSIIEDGSDPELETMAKDIVTAQTTEIAELTQIAGA